MADINPPLNKANLFRFIEGVSSPGMKHTTWPKLLVKRRIARIVLILGFFRRIQVIQIAEELIESLIDIVLLAFLVGVAFAIVWMKDLLAVIMLLGIYSLLSASFFVSCLKRLSNDSCSPGAPA